VTLRKPRAFVVFRGKGEKCQRRGVLLKPETAFLKVSLETGGFREQEGFSVHVVFSCKQ